jgi:hypothetical protein
LGTCSSMSTFAPAKVAGKKVYKLSTLNALTLSSLLPLAASSCSVLTALLRVSFVCGSA